MSEQMKILDVTYGKFSCRLEGFDDAVETMKVIVSYFHDLAGNENFLEVARGMPDLDTLARLAEAQSGGAVTAEPRGHGVSLTRHADDADDQTAPEVEAADEDVWSNLEAEDEIADDLPTEEEIAANDADDHYDHDDEDLNEGDDDEDPEADEVRSANMKTRILHDSWSDEEQASLSSSGLPEPAETFADDPSVTGRDDANFGRRLSRIRDAVSRSLTPPEPKPEQQAAVTPLRPGNPLAQRLAELAKRNSELMLADDRAISPLDQTGEVPADDGEVAEEQPWDMDDTQADDLASNAAEETAEDDLETDFAADTDEDRVTVAEADELEDEAVAFEEDLAEEDDVAEAAAAMVAEDDDDLYDDVAKFEDSTAEQEEVDDADALPTDAADLAPEQVDETEPEDRIAAEDSEDQVAAVAEDAPEGDDFDDDSDDDDDGTTAASDRPLLLTTPPTRKLSEDVSEDDDDDFDLAAELAEIEKEIANRPRNEMSRHGLPTRVEDAMSRIFSETNHQLDEPEGRRQRDALAQLKAAVAATEAARQLGDTARSRDAGQRFREDLGALSPEGQPRGEGLPPLKLVKTVEEERAKGAESVQSEPRISSKPLDAAAERLREIAAKKDTGSKTKAEDFVVFIDRHGVTDLGDRLEAAAAYITFVEGEADFTRPQLMRLVQSASREEITREDGLRCFGRLLRQARFSKLNNGRFKVDENTPFRPRSSRVAQG